MGGLTGAVHWWEEWQLRVLVLTSLFIQFFLLFFPYLRRRFLPGWFRFITWLAYHGGDAVAIYALATLFNRHKDQGDGGGSSSTLLEVVWAPVLLIHLGGCDGVTAYNIEDNELWSRHLLTAVSQFTVAIYVFCKSWPRDGDKMLLLAAIFLFVIGVVKCFYKAWAFKRASIYSLVSSGAVAKAKQKGIMYNRTTLEEYVKDARNIVIRQQPEEDPAVRTTTQAEDEAAEGSSNHPRSRLRRERAEARKNIRTRRRQEKERLHEERGEVSKLLVDLSSPYPRRIKIFENFCGLSKGRAYDSVQGMLAKAFYLLYTKLKTSGLETYEKDGSGLVSIVCIQCLRLLLLSVPLFFFSQSDGRPYHGSDVLVTTVLLACIVALEPCSVTTFLAVAYRTYRHSVRSQAWPQTVAQYSLAGYFVRNKKHRIKMRIASFFQCRDFVDQLWCMEPCFTSARITSLVLGYLEGGWKQKIKDAASYCSFNNHSSHWALNMNRPFDECVLLWHLATDFCFFSSSSFPDHKCACTTSKPQCSQESTNCKAVRCRQMSNYMVYLLFANPEMLLPGSRRNLFKTVYGELKDILKGWNWNPVCWSRCTPCGLGVKLMKEEAIVMDKLIKFMQRKTEKRAFQEESSKEVIVMETVVTVTQEKSERSSQEGSSMKGSDKEEHFIDQAWDLAQKLLKKEEMEMWKEIQDVWVQMLCFSASRCRGYLHAKALGKGGEFLSYVWLLLFYMGMETFSERLQRDLHPKEHTYPPPTSEVSTSARRHSTSF